MTNERTRRGRGMAIAEVVVAAAIVGLVATGIVTVYLAQLSIGIDLPNRVSATLLQKEGIEAVRYMRDSSWASNIAPLTLGATYYLSTSTGTWAATLAKPAADTGIFTRTVKFTAVNRDPNGNIAVSGANDPNTRLVTVTVSYPNGSATTTYSVSAYLTNLFSN